MTNSILAISSETPNMRTYTTAQRDRFAKFGDVTKNGVVFDWELANINGAAFTLIREPHHTDADMQLAEHHLRTNRDVVSLSIAYLEDATEDPQSITSVHAECSQCGTLYEFPATRDQFKRYFASKREAIQEIFPEIPDPARAVLTMGNLCALCLPQQEDVVPILAPYMR